MRTQKDRLHRVLIIGANPAGISAANKLGEMGVSITLVDRDPDLDAKLANEEWRLPSGVLLNYALRPGLLRILRNPRIRYLPAGEIASLKHTPQGFCAHVKITPSFVDPDRCTLCGRCAQVCPACGPDGQKAIRFHGRQSLPGRPAIDKRRQPLCQANCPLGVNAQGYLALVRAGRFPEALDLIRRDNVLPGICGRVCTHPCELACRRGELDEPVAIRDVKRFLSDREVLHPRAGQAAPPDSGKARVAVIGSGPAGLAAAADLARSGCSVIVFEKEPGAGGLLRYGIGPYRLPREILDRELDFIRELGVVFKTSCSVDRSDGLESVGKEYDAVVVASGAWKDRRLGVPGENLEGVDGCIEFLSRVHRKEIPRLDENVVIVGDGNSAFDLARTLVRLGARATVLSWFPENMIPADPAEVDGAKAEGVSVVCSAQVTAFAGTAGRFEKVRCTATILGKPDAKGIAWPVPDTSKEAFELPFDRAIVAIGQVAEMPSPLPVPAGQQGKAGTAATPAQGAPVRVGTALRAGIYAAGDIAQGPSSVVQAMASGRAAARAIIRELDGKQVSEALTRRPAEREFPPITPDIPSLDRAAMPERQPASRRKSFEEVALGLNESQAVFEANRCLQCGVCSECLQCVDACAASHAICHADPSDVEIEHAGVVIIADPEAAPSVKGEDVIRAYSPKAPKGDVHSMMLRGFAAAADAMLVLGGGSQRLKGHGLAFSPPAPQLNPEIRLGVFVCRCNDSQGWSDTLENYVTGLAAREQIVHAEALAAACTPEGTATLLRAIREKALTRVVMASCVCCPLDYICSSCTDQRTRLKNAVFNATGISRAMVETCNIRGEVLRLLSSHPELAFERFRGLIERSIGRARTLKALPAPARPYNFTTAVIGDSEAAQKSALTLAEAGMEVFHFGAPGRPLSQSPSHPNIYSFAGSTIEGLQGTVGNFQVFAEMNLSCQIFQAGAVILDDGARKSLPYTAVADLPPRILDASLQKQGVTGIPFTNPGSTSVPGLFLANPPGVNVSERIKGTAAAVLASSVMPRSPRQNKGFTVVVDEERCRGCGRCMQVCPYHAVSFRDNTVGGRFAVVDEALCKGCGNCIPVCPVNAADSPYRDRRYLEQMLEEILM
ncbi:MAG: FAD-dependent oxidoreductase [Desulfobacteraceae bacterium]|nr:FAD-dependent oxidoreductase [Desulfobacteraceae bacterium]